MNCQGPGHVNQQFANKTVEWKGTDSRENFESNCSNPDSYKKLKDLAWLDTKIYYSYNSEGFRDIEFNQQPSILALGCSHTEGIGITHDMSWPVQLEKITGYKVWNLGVGGAALDTCFRLLNFWIHKLNVVSVCCAVPSIERYEVFKDGRWNNISPGQKIAGNNWINEYNKNYILYDENYKCNREKNLLAMKQICLEKQVSFYFDTLEKFRDGAFARDLIHCGPETNIKLATSFFKQLDGEKNEIN